MREFTELTATEVEMVSGGASAAAATGNNSASAGAVQNLGITQTPNGIGFNSGATLNAGGAGGVTAVAFSTNASVAHAT